jgi:di- and tripeptidase
VYAIYSDYDIGDAFCVSYSSLLQTVYLGAQNTSIQVLCFRAWTGNFTDPKQWYDLKEKDTRPPPAPSTHPYFREDRFFDSLGPGGVRTPRPEHYSHGPCDAKGGQTLMIDKQHIKQFAHYGYVYCMVLTQGLHFEDGSPEVLISGGGDGAIKIWALDAAKSGAIRELHNLDDGREEGEPVHSLAVDGAFLYAGRVDGEVNVWDLETRQLVRNLRVKTDDVFALSVGAGHLFCAGVNGIVEVSGIAMTLHCDTDNHRNSTPSMSVWPALELTKVESLLQPSLNVENELYISREATIIPSAFGISKTVRMQQ